MQLASRSGSGIVFFLKGWRLAATSLTASLCPRLPASSLIHSIATRVIKLAHAKSSIALAPALVETYSRLLVYMEIESLGIKGFISELYKLVSEWWC